ncbi:YbjN domain-containing protein [uncultured Thiodictyon sp.]|jgi:hypothetical protein|uniref:YbjN domain-containing protein n=1 Tax=uncultured Thiodictyon sp. TaxID=1846217 RepID=UPI0025DD4FEA|nr:YbjN domain-containing protein [uncultured Thiodictyon sp.]
MTTLEALSEAEVTEAGLTLFFKRAFIPSSLDGMGNVTVEMDSVRVTLVVDENIKLMKFMAVFGLADAAPLELKHAFVNRLNENLYFARFSVPNVRPDLLIADYWLPFEEGISVFQIISALRWFAKIVPSAIHAYDTDHLVL